MKYRSEHGSDRKELKKHGLNTLTVLALSSIALTGCTNDTEAKPAPTTTHSAEAPTTEPEPSTSPSPEATETEQPEAAYTVNYERFNGWDSLDEKAKLAICDEFYEANGFVPKIELATSNTGEEILDWYMTRLTMAQTLNQDMSNDKNGEVALKLVECMTGAPADDDNRTRTRLENRFTLSRESSIDLDFTGIYAEKITRYSQDISLKEGPTGPYAAKVVEWVEVMDEINKNMIQEIFKWSEDDNSDIGQWQSVSRFPADTEISYGDKPPVVLDQSRANAPW